VPSEARLLYFAGNGSDDYGLTKLNFNYSIIHPNGKQDGANAINIPISNTNKTTYQYQWDTRAIDLQPGDQLSYYFELFDNDGYSWTKVSEIECTEFAYGLERRTGKSKQQKQ
jgi:hypothetical protein